MVTICNWFKILFSWWQFVTDSLLAIRCGNYNITRLTVLPVFIM